MVCATSSSHSDVEGRPNGLLSRDDEKVRFTSKSCRAYTTKRRGCSIETSDPYWGQLVVLRMLWNIKSNQIGVVVEILEKDRVVVLWTVKRGYELKIHSKDALLPINDTTIKKVKERNCVFK